MSIRLCGALRTPIFARAMVIGKAEKTDKKAGKKGGLPPAAPLLPTTDLVNIYVDKKDPEFYPLRMYPPFLKELLYLDSHAIEYPRLINEGYDISVRAQWRLINFMRRYKIRQRMKAMDETYYDESSGEEGMVETSPFSNMNDPELSGIEGTVPPLKNESNHYRNFRKQLANARFHKEPETDNREEVKKLMEKEREREKEKVVDDEEAKEKEERKAMAAAQQQKKIDALNKKLQGIKIGDKRVRILGRKDRKLLRKLKKEKKLKGKEKVEKSDQEDEYEAQQKLKRQR
eukprot:TRINITY_DN7899_c0_g1_i11.p1 TRINITY_DN7899_c0_g1~~TRINITY_DN7899_c0_g1_i11.p1  ORF type:complete len:288 (-),score=107.99 TRINITY_DN7899_c0_g1_i11:207-1070(-)